MGVGVEGVWIRGYYLEVKCSIIYLMQALYWIERKSQKFHEIEKKG